MIYDHRCVVISKAAFWKNDWDTEQRKYRYTPILPEHIYTELKATCEIDPDVTLLDIMNLVDANDLLKTLISQYSWCGAIDKFHAQVREPMRTDEKPLRELQIGWGVVHEEDYDFHPNFYGIGEEIDGHSTYSVSYTPLYNLADIPVTLDKHFKVVSRFKKKTPSKIVLEGTKNFTLLEVLDGIYDDISFMGGPDENIKFLEEMKEDVERIKRGDVELISFDDFLESDGDKPEDPRD